MLYNKKFDVEAIRGDAFPIYMRYLEDILEAYADTFTATNEDGMPVPLNMEEVNLFVERAKKVKGDMANRCANKGFNFVDFMELTKRMLP